MEESSLFLPMRWAERRGQCEKFHCYHIGNANEEKDAGGKDGKKISREGENFQGIML